LVSSKKSSKPIGTNRKHATGAMRRKTCKRCQGQEKRVKRVTFGFGFSVNWLKKGMFSVLCCTSFGPLLDLHKLETFAKTGLLSATNYKELYRD